MEPRGRVDLGFGARLRALTPGELGASGDGVCCRYQRDPSATAQGRLDWESGRSRETGEELLQ